MYAAANTTQHDANSSLQDLRDLYSITNLTEPNASKFGLGLASVAQRTEIERNAKLQVRQARENVTDADLKLATTEAAENTKLRAVEIGEKRKIRASFLSVEKASKSQESRLKAAATGAEKATGTEKREKAVSKDTMLVLESMTKSWASSTQFEEDHANELKVKTNTEEVQSLRRKLPILAQETRALRIRSDVLIKGSQRYLKYMNMPANKTTRIECEDRPHVVTGGKWVDDFGDACAVQGASCATPQMIRHMSEIPAAVAGAVTDACCACGGGVNRTIIVAPTPSITAVMTKAVKGLRTRQCKALNQRRLTVSAALVLMESDLKVLRSKMSHVTFTEELADSIRSKVKAERGLREYEEESAETQAETVKQDDSLLQKDALLKKLMADREAVANSIFMIPGDADHSALNTNMAAITKRIATVHAEVQALRTQTQTATVEKLGELGSKVKAASAQTEHFTEVCKQLLAQTELASENIKLAEEQNKMIQLSQRLILVEDNEKKKKHAYIQSRILNSSLPSRHGVTQEFQEGSGMQVMGLQVYARSKDSLSVRCSSVRVRIRIRVGTVSLSGAAALGLGLGVELGQSRCQVEQG